MSTERILKSIPIVTCMIVTHPSFVRFLFVDRFIFPLIKFVTKTIHDPRGGQETVDDLFYPNDQIPHIKLQKK